MSGNSLQSGRARKSADGHAARRFTPRKNFCFGCGKDNPQGMKLKFRYDEAGKRFVCKFRLTRRYAGPPGYAHGGIIATILDEAMAKLNKPRQVLAVTSKMEVRYLRPVPLGRPLTVESREVRVRGREHIYAAEIRDGAGQALATSRGKFIKVDPGRVFGTQAGNAVQRLNAQRKRYETRDPSTPLGFASLREG